MKINICFKEVAGPWGGGNQFLKYLKKYFTRMGVYENNPFLADIILFNSHHDIERVVSLRQKNKDAIFVHRIDGPISLIRGTSHHDDLRVLDIANNLADAIVVQSNWSKYNLEKIANENNFKIKKPVNLILNTADPEYFTYSSRKEDDTIKMVATSWSNNMKKGFKDYALIDEMLSLKKYSHIKFDFIGRSPLRFKNIRILDPLSTKELGRKMQEYDVYITASQKDPCSNALCESIQVGLFPVVYDDGGHVEICKNYGSSYLKYSDSLEIENLLDKLSNSEILKKKPDFIPAHLVYLNLFKRLKKGK